MTCSKCGRTGYESHAKLEKHSRQCRSRIASDIPPSRFSLPPDALKKLESVRR